MKTSHPLAAALLLLGASALAQDPSPTPASPTPSPAASPTLVLPTPTPSPALVLPTPPEVSGVESQVAATPPPDEMVIPGSGATPDAKIESDIKWSETTYKATKGTSFASQPPSPANGITLDQAVATAIQKNATILAQLATIKETRGQIIEIRAQALPQLNATSDYTQTDASEPTRSTTKTPSYSSNVLINGQRSIITYPASSSSTSGGSTQSWNLTFQATQLLYSGGNVSAAIRGAKIAEDSAFYQLRDTVDSIISQVRKQFYTVLLNRALIKVEEESVALLESQLKDQQNRFEAGTVPRFDVLQASVALANERPTLIKARNNYKTAQLTLAKLVGVSWPTDTDSSPFPVKGLLAYEPRKINLGAAIQTALERRPSLKVQRATILSDVEDIKVQLAGYKPSISANAGWEFANDSSSSNLTDYVNGWFFGFTGNWAIFDGLETHGKVLQARARLESAKVNYEDAVRQIELDVQDAYLSLDVARETIESQQQTVAEAEESLRLSRERLSAGAGTQLDVLNSQVALTEAQSTGLQALADYDTALAEFDYVTGATTSYHSTFDDPLVNPEVRKHWFSKKRNQKLDQPSVVSDGKTLQSSRKRKATTKSDD